MAKVYSQPNMPVFPAAVARSAGAQPFSASPLPVAAPIYPQQFAPISVYPGQLRPGQLNTDHFQAVPAQPLEGDILAAQNQAKINMGWLEGMWARRPFSGFYTMRRLGRTFSAKSTTPIQESPAQMLKMFKAVKRILTPKGQEQLQKLLTQGVLHERTTEEGQKTLLYQLYSMLTTQRAAGYNSKALVREAVDILADPGAITQKIPPLSPQGKQRILMEDNGPLRENTCRRQGFQNYALPDIHVPQKQVRPEDLDVEYSATCVSSSVMYYMATKEPAELIRHLNGLTSKVRSTVEQVSAKELSPENPAEAINKLTQHGMPFKVLSPNDFLIQMQASVLATERAIDSQKAEPHHRTTRGALETIYQSVLTSFASPGYDPAIDLMLDGSSGLTEEQKTAMETAIKDNQGTRSVSVQQVTSGLGQNSNDNYLIGYNQPFEQTLSQLEKCFAMGEPVVVGITETDASGKITTGHELTLTALHKNPEDGSLYFIVADSDDDKPELVTRSVAELLPKIHHMGLPLKLAEQLPELAMQEQARQTGQVLIPDQQDAQKFQLIPLASQNPSPQA
ncbi:MAG: hypothetical protein AAGI66_06185 [Cyanobacteria bacterium P01_H01_bin.74]